MTTILITAAFSALLAFIIGILLGWFEKKFKVERDPKIDEVRAALPGANCGGCGFPGCDGYAEAVATGRAATTKSCRTPSLLTVYSSAKPGRSHTAVSVLACTTPVIPRGLMRPRRPISTARTRKRFTRRE